MNSKLLLTVTQNSLTQYRDFLQRCKDYGVTDVEVPQPSQDASSRPASEQAKIASMVSEIDILLGTYKISVKLG